LCSYCGTPLLRRRLDLAFCNSRCDRMHAKALQTPPRVCPYCGKGHARGQGCKTCGSRECVDAHKKTKRIERAGFDYDPVERAHQRRTLWLRGYRDRASDCINAKARATYAVCPHTKAQQRERKHKRKAILLAATIDGSAPARYRELLSTATSCHWCASPITPSTMEIDHYHPLSRGGLHVASNLVASCARCNRQRRDMTADEYAKWKEKRLECAKAAAA
jgi:5-methylcytosine-specific restriction endonuclease McrA